MNEEDAMNQKPLQAIADQAQVPAGFNFADHLQRQRDFSEKTFGPGARTAGVVDHIRKELKEIEAAPDDITEWIDVVILALDGAWRSGASPQQIIDAMVSKQTKNEGRIWPDWRTAPTDRAIEHDRTGELSAAPQQTKEPVEQEAVGLSEKVRQAIHRAWNLGIEAGMHFNSTAELDIKKADAAARKVGELQKGIKLLIELPSRQIYEQAELKAFGELVSQQGLDVDELVAELQAPAVQLTPKE